MMTEMTKAAEKTPAETPETVDGGTIYRPVADIVETDQGVTLFLEMPGVTPENVDITLEKRILSIRGRTNPPMPEKLNLVYAEYGEGDYERAFTLSEDFDPDRIEATMHDGVLTVTLPHAEAAKPKKIAVKGN